MHCFFAILLMQLRYYSAFLSVILKVVKYLLGPVLVGIVLETLFHRNLAPCSLYFCWAELVLHISNWVLKKRETFCISHMFSLAIRRDLKKRVATEVISGMEWFYGKELHHTFQKYISHMWWERGFFGIPRNNILNHGAPSSNKICAFKIRDCSALFLLSKLQ